MSRTWLVGLVLLAACGDDKGMPIGDDDQPDVDASPDVPAFEITCERNLPLKEYKTGADFGTEAVPGTLKNWDSTGRWFFTGIQVGSVSSMFIEPAGAGKVYVDRDQSVSGTLDDSELFHRLAFSQQGQSYVIAKRITNRAADGTARAERAVCDGGSCRVCTAKLERATHFNNEGEGDHLTLLGQLNDPTWGPGYTFNVRMLGTIAYLIRQDGLHIIETADPAHPVELGKWHRSGDGYSNDIKLVQTQTKKYAIIADYGVDIVDVTDPVHPVLATQMNEQAHTLAIESREGYVRAYFGDYDGTCPVYDIADPAHPTKLGSYTSGGHIAGVHDLNIENGIAYLDTWEAGFQIVDFTNPAMPNKLAQHETPTMTTHSSWTTTVAGRHIALVGEEAYGAHLQLFDVDPANTATYGKPFVDWKTRDHVSIHNLMAFGNKAYFSHYQDGIRVLDLSDPTAPKQVGYYNTWDPDADYTTSDFFEGAVGLDVDLARKLIFVADSPRGLLILRDETP